MIGAIKWANSVINPLKDHEWNHRKDRALSFETVKTRTITISRIALANKVEVSPVSHSDSSNHRHSPDTNGQGRGHHKGINKPASPLVARLFPSQVPSRSKPLNLSRVPDNGPITQTRINIILP